MVQPEPIVTTQVMLMRTKTMFATIMKTGMEMQTETVRRCNAGEMAVAGIMLFTGEVMAAAEAGNCKC